MSDVLIERRGRVLVLTLNRPDSLNALVIPMGRAIRDAVADAAGDASVGALVITGAGRAFCSGGDIAFMKEVVDAGGRWDDFRALVEWGRDIALEIDRCPKPVVGVIQGAAFGGGVGLVACCDIAIATSSASFCLSEVRLGLIPAVISPYVAAAIGPRACRRYFLTAEKFDSATAAKLGLIHRVAEPVAGLVSLRAPGAGDHPFEAGRGERGLGRRRGLLGLGFARTGGEPRSRSPQQNQSSGDPHSSS